MSVNEKTALAQSEEPGQRASDSDRQAGLPSAVNESRKTVIRYRPHAGAEKWLKQRFSAWSQFKAWFVMTLVVVFFYFGGPGLIIHGVIRLLMGSAAAAGTTAAIAAANGLVLQVLTWGLSALVLTGYAIYIRQPTHLILSREGLQLYWQVLLKPIQGRVLPWESLNHVYLLRPGGKTTVNDYLICFQYKDGKLLRFKLAAIVSTEDKERLLNAINAWAPEITMDPEVLEVLTPAQDHSYTELWLQALTAPPKRERLTPLPEGASLKDGAYLVINQLGVGGQGTAYAALLQEADRQETVVLKESILPVYVEANVRRQALENFQREAAMLRRLDHAQIVKLVDYFVEDHRSYLVLEHIDGMSLRQLVQEKGVLPENEVRSLALQMCDILAYLHSLVPPVVHRDFTPDNLIMNLDGALKLIDFTVAQQMESGATGTVVGKHAYLPPEQFRGKPCPQSDIYALGGTLYYLLTGADPEPITPSHPIIVRQDISGQLDAIVAQATQVDLAKRYENIARLGGDLQNGDRNI